MQSDLAEFSNIYNRYCDEFYQIALSICGNTTEAEDIVQDTFIKIYNKMDTLRDKDKLENWMKTILVNTARTTVKKWWRKIDTVDEQTPNINLSSLNTKNSSGEILIELLQHVPLGYRNVFVLHAMQQIPQSDVSRILGITVGTVKSQYFKAKKILRTKLEEIGVHNE